MDFIQELKSVCESTLSIYKKNKYEKQTVDTILDDYSKDVRIIFDKKFGTDIKNDETDLNLFSTISPYRKQLYNFLMNKEL